jgi:hypothetical protein
MYNLTKNALVGPVVPDPDGGVKQAVDQIARLARESNDCPAATSGQGLAGQSFLMSTSKKLGLHRHLGLLGGHYVFETLAAGGVPQTNQVVKATFGKD